MYSKGRIFNCKCGTKTPLDSVSKEWHVIVEKKKIMMWGRMKCSVDKWFSVKFNCLGCGEQRLVPSMIN